MHIKLKRLIKSKRVVYESHIEYAGEHSAPDKNSGTSMDKAGEIWPNDIYNNNAVTLYGDHSPDYNDWESISVIQNAKNRPNKPVKIYRAVPDVNYDVTKRLKEFYYILNYIHKFGFAPMNNTDVDEAHKAVGYDKVKLIQYFSQKTDELQKQLKKSYGLNVGDWVSPSKSYVKDHGRNTLMGKYKIVTKTVLAKHLYTDANSVHEWGYDPS